MAREAAKQRRNKRRIKSMSSKSKNLRAFASSRETKNEEAKPALVPKLRFAEFSKPWAFEPLSKVLTEHKLKNSAGREVFSVSMEYGIVNQIEHLGRSFAAADTSHYTVGRRYDVVYTKSPLKAFPFGIVKQCKFDGEVALSPLYGVFTPSNPHLGLMIEAYFESPNRSKDFLSPLCQKGAKNTLQITNTTFLSGRLPLPTQPAEQQKIAECLSSVDDLIAAQARKVDALKTHKKGLMQQLFPREGETQPRLRFPEFQNAGEWEEKAGCDLFTQRKEKGKEGLPIYSVTVNDGMVPRASFDRNFYDIEDPAGNRKVHKGDIAYNMMRMWQGAQGVAPEDCMVSPAYVVLKPRSGVCADFFAYLFKLPQSLRLLTITSRGLTKDRLRLYFDDFAKMPLCVPEKAEQHRIATCLSSLDALITAETQKNEALKIHKKALMQQLFPMTESA
jgi:type I restriction enzyme S subunit